MARTIGVEIVGDSRSLERAFARSEKAATNFQRHIGGTLGRRVGAGAAVTAFTVAIKNSVIAASDLQEQLGKTNVVFGQNATAIRAWAQTSASKMGLAEDQALATASSFGALFRPLGIVGKTAADQSQMLTQLGADLASFYNTDVQSALDAIRSGLVGESEPLRRYGVLLSETRVQQEAMKETGKDSAKQLTDQEKVLARITLILKDTTAAQGDYARTSGNAANQTRTLKANVRDLGETIGGFLLPAVTATTAGLNEMLDTSGNFGTLAALARLATRDVLTLGRSLDQIENTRAGRVFADQGQGITGAATAGRRPSAAATAAANRQTMQRNQAFDAQMSRMLGRANDPTSLRAQITRYRAIAGLIQQRLAATKDITRRLRLEDELADIAVQIRDRQQQQAATARQKAAEARQTRLETQLGWLGFGLERAEATKRISDVRTWLRKIEAYWKERIRHEGRKLEFAQEVWRAQQKIRDLNKKTDADPLAGFAQVSTRQLTQMLAAGTGLNLRGQQRLAQNIAGAEFTVHNVVVLDGREVARSVNRHNARAAHRTARQTSGFRD